MCGRGPNKVWIVRWNDEIRGVFHDPDNAKYLQERIVAHEADHGFVWTEDWEVK